MFDSIFATCPECEARVEFQSKAGECILASYSIPGNIPVEIAKDIEGKLIMCECGYVIVAESGLCAPQNTIPMFVS
jgi:hypothetical protein|tara:strand:- start:4398 stop:4625 length:228 start_codon:yes stop_codon:yes gene_type:complete